MTEPIPELLDRASVRGGRDRIAPPAEAAALIAAAPPQDRAKWATAAYAGLRLGELQALRIEDIDLKEGLIRVERSWDRKERQVVTGKSRASRRKVPLVAALRPYLTRLLAELMAAGRRSGLLFGRTADQPFSASSMVKAAARAWAAAGLGKGLTPHEFRHTFASICIAAGVNAKALSTYMGHASIQTTFDLYGHLFPGNEEQAAELLDAYLEGAGLVS
jgi:integrase